MPTIVLLDERDKAELQGQISKVASAIPNTASGSAVALTDISPLKHTLGIKARSENILPYPFYETTKTAGGVTFTDNGDSSLTLNGDATSNITFWLVSPLSERKIGVGAYTVSVFADKAISGNAVAMLQRYNESQTLEKTFGETSNNLTFTNDKEGWLAIRFFVYSGASFDNVTFCFKLKEGTETTPFTPYIADITTANVQRYEKNLYDNATITEKLFPTATGYEKYKIILPNGTYTWSLQENNFIGSNAYVVFTDDEAYSGASFAAGCFVSWIGHSSAPANCQLKGTFTVTKGYIYLARGGAAINKIVPLLETMQIEAGTEATPFEPYTEPTTYPVNADGTVEGVTSIYPTTTLIPDTEGVVIDVDYFVDTKKFILSQIAKSVATLTS